MTEQPIDNYYLTAEGALLLEAFDDANDTFVTVALFDQEQVCQLLDMLLADFRCQIVDRSAHRHCHRCGHDIGPLSSHACANEALTSARRRLDRAAGVSL